MQHWSIDGFPEYENCLTYLRTLLLQNKNILLRVIDSISQEDINSLVQGHNKILLTSNRVNTTTSYTDRIVEFGNEWYGIYAGTPNVVYRDPVKDFNCFINRMDPFRQSWAYQLVRRKLFEQGFVSFNMDISRHILQKQCPPNALPMDVFEQQFRDHCAIFANEHQLLKDIVPYKNFQSENLSQVVVDSKFSLVLETYHDTDRYITFSEKIFRCLKLPRPWVVHAQRGAVAQLRTIGFDVLDDLVDHNYDNLDSTVDRQTAILDRCEILSNINIDQCLPRLQQAARHNVELLETFQQSWKKTIDQTFEVAKDKLEHN